MRFFLKKNVLNDGQFNYNSFLSFVKSKIFKLADLLFSLHFFYQTVWDGLQNVDL